MEKDVAPSPYEEGYEMGRELFQSGQPLPVMGMIRRTSEKDIHRRARNRGLIAGYGDAKEKVAARPAATEESPASKLLAAAQNVVDEASFPECQFGAPEMLVQTSLIDSLRDAVNEFVRGRKSNG